MQTASPFLERQLRLVHGGADNDSMTIGAIVGGTAGGGLGADTLIVNGNDRRRSADDQQGDPNSTSDKR